MASAQTPTCEICMNYFNSTDRKAVALPCGHDFCLTCLVCLKTAGSHKCPKCRGDWAELEVQALPGMALGAAAQEEEGEWLEKWRKTDCRCSNHDIFFDFWSIKEKMFRCKKCIIELGLKTSELQLIGDAVPIIKSVIAAKFAAANKNIKQDIESIDSHLVEFGSKFQHVSNFSLQVQQLEEKLQESISITKALRSKRLNDSALAKKVDDEREKIKSEADIGRMVSSMAILEALSQPCRLPALLEQESLLCHIACTYMEKEEELPSSAAFISGLMKATVNSALPLTKAVFDADELRDDEEWPVHNSNCLAALLALADRQPSILHLTSRHNEPMPLPAAAVAAVAKAARNCEVWLELYHSFFKPETRNTDRKLLEHFLGISSHRRLTTFFGHLDEAGIAMLPTTIFELGLAIGSAADATAVSGLKPWKNLQHLHVSVISHVAACDLSQLPSNMFLYLYFPDLTDASVDSVRPAIEALVPDMKLKYLVLPLTQLTATGTLRLVQQLRRAQIEEVTIDPCGPWQPGKLEMESIGQELRSAVGCRDIVWNMDWLY